MPVRTIPPPPGTATQGALARWLLRLEQRSALTADERAGVMGLTGRLESFGSGRDIVPLGRCVTHACLVVDGLIARFGQTSAGGRQLTAFYLPGDMADLHSAVLPLVTAPLQSALRATVLYVPHEEILALAERYPGLGRALWRDCVADAQIASEWLLNNGRRDAQSRTAHLLCELSLRYEAAGLGDARGFPMDFTQTHLADATGLTPVHVNRVLRELREAGAVTVRDRRFDLDDLALLRRIGDFDPAYLHFARRDPPAALRRASRPI